MKRVLLTGMSGVGKSTVAERLSELGYRAIDNDYGGFSEVDEHGYQRWESTAFAREGAAEAGHALIPL